MVWGGVKEVEEAAAALAAASVSVSAESKGGEEDEEVRGRCWVRRAAMREDVKSWTCVRISRPINTILVLFSSTYVMVG